MVDFSKIRLNTGDPKNTNDSTPETTSTSQSTEPVTKTGGAADATTDTATDSNPYDEKGSLHFRRLRDKWRKEQEEQSDSESDSTAGSSADSDAVEADVKAGVEADSSGEAGDDIESFIEDEESDDLFDEFFGDDDDTDSIDVNHGLDRMPTGRIEDTGEVFTSPTQLGSNSDGDEGGGGDTVVGDKVIGNDNAVREDNVLEVENEVEYDPTPHATVTRRDDEEIQSQRTQRDNKLAGTTDYIRRNERRVKAIGERRLRNSSGKLTYATPRGGLDSNFARRGPQEHLVNDEGIPVRVRRSKSGKSKRFEALVNAADHHGDVVLDHRSKETYRQYSAEVIGTAARDGDVTYPWRAGELDDIVEVLPSRKRAKRTSQQKVNRKEASFFQRMKATRQEMLEEPERISELRRKAGETRKQQRQRKEREDSLLGGAHGFAGYNKRGLTGKDFDYLTFLSKFRYATAKHLAQLQGVKEETAHRRLWQLRSMGLVDSIPVAGVKAVWVVTSIGMQISGYDLPLINYKNFNYSQIGHQFTVNNTAANLAGGQVNVLSLPEFPLENRRNHLDKLVLGEEVVSETQILSSFGRMREAAKADIFRPRILGEMDSEFRRYEEEGGAKAGVISPELLPGNEYMWVLLPPRGEGEAYHVPDLVMPRSRNENGTPESVAIEIELGTKSSQKYESILRAYKADHKIFKKVIWVCRDLYPARLLEQAAKATGLWQEGRIDIVPIITTNGVFKGRDLWTV